MKLTPPVVEITEENANEAIRVLSHAMNQGNPLAPELRIVLSAATSYLRMLDLLSRRGIGIRYLRRVLGIDPVPELAAASSAAKDPKHDKKKGRHNHGRRGKKEFPKADHRYFAHPGFDEPGTLCPDCGRGHVYPDQGAWHRFHGQPMLRVLIVHHEIWRCTLCQQSFSAPIAKDILNDGDMRRPFGFSATALIVISKYFFGTPWSRQERLQKMLELPMPASTLHDQTSQFADAAAPIYDLLGAVAANARRFFTDDTGVRILKQLPIMKQQRKTGKETLRCGVHASAMLADLKNGIRIVLFKSGILHAGEFLDEILKNRDKELAPPLHMSDGSSCNPATVTGTIECNCNSHGRRKLEEKQELYPEHWAVMKAVYRDVYKNDAYVKEQGLSDDERLAYHREHSKKLMEDMFEWMQREFDLKNVEPNSGLGGIFEYFLARKEKLMAFTKHPGAPLDSNAVEQIIKLVALLRKNAMFFMTARGAWMADVILSIGATAGLHGVNLYDYFVCILKYRDEVEQNPAAFLPWEYQKTVQKLRETGARDPTPQVQELTAEQWHARQEQFKTIRAELHQARLRPAA